MSIRMRKRGKACSFGEKRGVSESDCVWEGRRVNQIVHDGILQKRFYLRSEDIALQWFQQKNAVEEEVFGEYRKKDLTVKTVLLD